MNLAHCSISDYERLMMPKLHLVQSPYPIVTLQRKRIEVFLIGYDLERLYDPQIGNTLMLRLPRNVLINTASTPMPPWR